MKGKSQKVCDFLDRGNLRNARYSLEGQFLGAEIGGAKRNLRVLRVITGLTSIQLAEISGVSQSLIRSVENGQRPLLIGNALAIALKTGVDPISLLVGETLLEWGGAKPFTTNTYTKWAENNCKPSRVQEENGHRQLVNLCQHACENLGAGHFGDGLLTAYLYVLMGGVDDEIQYAGIEKDARIRK